MQQNSSDGAVRGCVCERIGKCTKMQSTAGMKMRVECCSAICECTCQLRNFIETAELTPKKSHTWLPEWIPSRAAHKSLCTHSAATDCAGLWSGSRVAGFILCLLTKINGAPTTFERDNGKKSAESARDTALRRVTKDERQPYPRSHSGNQKPLPCWFQSDGSLPNSLLQAELKNELRCQVEVQQRDIEGDVNRECGHRKSPREVLGV